MSPIRPTVTVIGHRLDSEHHRLRDFLTRSAQPFVWLDAGSGTADEALSAHGAREAALPVLVEESGQVLAGATVERLLEAWQLDAGPAHSSYDVAIAGGGPAGLAAAVYAASDGLSTIVFEEDLPGGQASHTSLIENFFGFPDGIGGAELARLAGRQAERFGAEVMVTRGVTGSGFDPDGRFRLQVAGGYEVTARAVIAAPGMVWRRLEVEGVEELLGRGVYYGAGRSEAAQCRGEPVVVVGAGNSAGQAVMNLADAGARVTMLVRGDRLDKSMSAYLVERINDHRLIDVRLRTQVEALEAGGRLAGVRIEDADGGRERLAARALFLCLGGLPRTGWAAESGVRLDQAAFVLTGPDLLESGRRPGDWPLARDPLALETSVPGLFAAGDVRHGSTKRVAVAVGEGAMAVALVHRRLGELVPGASTRPQQGGTDARRGPPLGYLGRLTVDRGGTRMSQGEVDPSHIMQVGMGFWPSKTVLSAVELELFTHLGAEPMTGEEVGERLELHPRAIYDFLDTLVALGFLERDGEGSDGRYRNTADTAAFLDKRSPRYIGGILEMANARLYRFWGDLTEALKTGEPQNEVKHSGRPMFEELYSDPARLEQFMDAMQGVSLGNFHALAEQFDFSSYETVCDVGGASGQLCTILAGRHPHLHCTTYDLPVVAPIAEKAVAAAGMSDRVTVASGDFFADPLPQADVITMGLILHDWNLDRKMQLIRAAYEALPEGGAYIIIENLIDDARRENAFGLMMSLNMLIEFGDAFDFTGSDFAGWCREAGFREVEILPLTGPASAGIAYK